MNYNEISHNPDLKAARRQFSRLGGILVLFFAIVLLVQTAAAVFLQLLYPNGNVPDWIQIALSFGSMYLCGFPVFLCAAARLPAKAPDQGKLKISDLLIAFLISVPLLYAGNLLGNLVGGLFGSLTGFEPANTTIEMVLSMNMWLELFLVVFLGPFVEEFMFRRVLLDRTRAYGEKNALIFSALLFAFYHLNVYQFFYAFFIGLLLGYLYLRTGRLLAVWCVHAAVNFFGSTIPMLLIRYGGYAELLARMDAPEEMMQYLAENPLSMLWVMLYGFTVFTLLILGCVFFALCRKKIVFKTSEKQLPRDSEATVCYVNPGVICFIAVTLLLTILNQIAL